MSIIGDAFVAIHPETSTFGSQLEGAIAGPLARTEGMFGGVGKVGALAFGGVVLAAVGAGAEAVRMAGNFQAATTLIVTGAGESASNLDLIRQGLLNMAPQVATTPAALAAGLFLVESAGYHGQAGLDVLRVAAEGAKVGMAPLPVVADALTTALNAYHQPASMAAVDMNILTSAVALGKTHMADLAGTMGAILPIAASLGIPFDQVAAAIATMTVQGTDAAKASQSLRFLLAALAGPTAAAAKEFQGLGIGMKDIPGISASTAAELGKLGLHTSAVAATLAGPGGLPAAMKMITDAIGKQFPVGSAQYNAALKAATGGTRGFTAAIELSGANAKLFNDNIATIDKNVHKAGNSVMGWTQVQGDFNTKIDAARAGVDAFLIRVGTALLPVLSRLADWFTTTALPALSRFSDWFGANGVPAIQAFAGIVATIASTALPPLVAVLGFLAGHLDALGRFIAVAVIGFAALKLALIGQAIFGVITALIGAYNLMLAGATIAEAAAAIGATSLGVALDFMLGPWGLIVLAIVAVIAIGVLLITHWSQVKAFVSTLAAHIGGFFVAAWHLLIAAIAAALTWFGKIPGVVGGAISAAIQHVVKFGTDVWNFITGAIGKVIAWITTELPKIPQQVGFALGFAIGTIIKFGMDAWTWVTTVIPQFVNSFVGFIATLPGLVWQQFLNLIAYLANLATQMWTWVTTNVNNFVNSFVGFIATLPGKVWAWLVGVVTNLGTLAGQMWSWVTTSVPAWIASFVGFIQGLPAQLWTWFAGIIANLGTLASDMWNWVTTSIPNFVTQLISYFTGLPARMLQIGIDMVQGIINGITGMLGAATSAIGSFVGGLVSGAKTAIMGGSPSRLFAEKIGLPIAQGIAVGITENAALVGNALQGVLMPGQMAPLGLGVAAMATGGAGGSIGAMQGASGGAVNITQHFHNNSGSLAEMQAVVRQENATLITALRAGRR